MDSYKEMHEPLLAWQLPKSNCIERIQKISKEGVAKASRVAYIYIY